MTSYARGQESFVSRLILNIRNFTFLLIASSLVGISFFGVLLYCWLPERFWSVPPALLRNGEAHLARNGIGAVPEAARLISIGCQELYLAFQPTIEEAFCYGAWGSGAFFIVLFVVFAIRGQQMMAPNYRRGALLISAREFNRGYHYVMNQELREIQRDRPPGTRGNKLTKKMLYGRPFLCGADGLKIPEYALFRHMAMVGATGVGKSTLIKAYLEHCRARGEKVIIPDINGEYASEFFRPGDKILSLFDPASAYWTFAAEDKIHPFEFARFLVPSGDERNAFWWKGARQVVGQLLSQTKSPENLWELINRENGDLSASLSGLAKKIAGKEGSPQAAGIAGSSLLDLGFLEYLNCWPKQRGDQAPFSLFSWAQDRDPSWVFITFADTDRELMCPLLRVWINTAILGLLKRQTGQGLPLNIVVDELATMGKIELLTTALERVRKYRGKVVLGYQSESQLLDLYGRNGALSIRANTGSKFIFRSPEAGEARDLSDFLGRQEIRNRQMGTSLGAKTAGERENISEHETLRNIVLDSEIRDLPDGYFYLKSLNVNPVRSRVVKKVWPKVYSPMFRFPATDAKGGAISELPLKVEEAGLEPEFIIAAEL